MPVKRKKKPGPKKKRGVAPSARWNLFWKSLAENPKLSIAEHGRKAGFAEKYIRSGEFYTHANTRKLEFDKIMEKHGLTDEFLIGKIKEGIGKKKTIFLKQAEMPHPDKKKGKIFLYDPKDLDDNQIQFNYAELALKMKGKLIQKHQHEVVDDEGDTSLDTLTKDQLKQIEGVLKGKKKKKAKGKKK